MAISPGTYSFSLRRRADYPLQLQFLDSNREPINLTGWTVQAQLWSQHRTTKHADLAVTYTDRATGLVELVITDEQTTTLPGEVFYDVLLTNPSGLKEYYLEGQIKVLEGYTA